MADKNVFPCMIAAAVTLMASVSALSEPFSSMGIGSLTCAQFLELYRSDPATEDRFFDWAQSFMTGLNDALEETAGKYRDLKSIPTAQQKQILRTFCSNNQTAGYRDAINFLLTRLTVVPSTLKGAK